MNTHEYSATLKSVEKVMCCWKRIQGQDVFSSTCSCDVGVNERKEGLLKGIRTIGPPPFCAPFQGTWTKSASKEASPGYNLDGKRAQL